MIDLYNNLIVIILIIVISILFTKLIYSNNYVSIENFQDSGFNFRNYYGKLGDGRGENKFTLDGGVIDRLSRDPDVLNAIRINFKNDYLDSVVPRINENKQDFEKAIAVKSEAEAIPTKFASIIGKYQDLNENYNLKKKTVRINFT